MTEEPPSRTPALLAIVFIAVLVTGGYFLSRYLSGVGHMEDCMMAGRRACGVVVHGG
jgi:hypothetical protein